MNLTEVVISQLGDYGSRRGREFTWLAGQIADFVAQPPEVIEPLLATTYWSILAPEPVLRLRRVGRLPLDVSAMFDGLASPNFNLQALVITHGNPARYSLLVLDPQYESSDFLSVKIPSGTASRIIEEALSDRRSRTAVFSRASFLAQRILEDLVSTLISANSRQRPGRYHRNLSRYLFDLCRRAMIELARAEDSGVVLARRPEIEPTSCFSPASVVRTSAGETATAGLMFVNHDGHLLLSTANHAIKEDDTVTVADMPATVVARDLVTDSCILRLDDKAPCHLYDKAARLRRHGIQELGPRPNEPALFDGAISELTETFIRTSDPSIAFESMGFGNKVYTDNDTVPGDSGAALYDTSERMVGFAAYRTKYGEVPSYSIWIWAKQVLQHHRLNGRAR
ncbi:serine protease [Amycolatopsis sp. NPDC101161]|uniref:S1 family peptidase n=1 Tax=Amycolatopsis sp. NPDC101161 TaxID=3363940 RepID=UPI0038184B24